MHLTFISTLFPNRVQPTRALYNLRHLSAIRDLGHDVQIISPTPWFPGHRLLGRPLPPLAEEWEGFKVVHPRFFAPPGMMLHYHYKFYRSAVRRLLQNLAAKAPATHVIIGFAYPDAAATMPLCHELGLPYSVFVLGSDFRIRINQPRFRNLVLDTLQATPLIFCPGKELKTEMLAVGIESKQIFPFNNGVDHALFYCKSAHDRHGKARTVLFVGNLVEVKGVDRLITAFAQIVHSRLDIVGDGPLRAELEKHAAKLGLNRQVNFHGRQAPEVIANMMRQTHCLCLPSRSEGMPNVVLEALACGTPVVATDVGEVPHLIEDGRNGFVVAHGTHGKTQIDEERVITVLADTLGQALTRDWNAEQIAAGVAGYTWEAAAQTVITAIAGMPREGHGAEEKLF